MYVFLFCFVGARVDVRRTIVCRMDGGYVTILSAFDDNRLCWRQKSTSDATRTERAEKVTKALAVLTPRFNASSGTIDRACFSCARRPR